MNKELPISIRPANAEDVPFIFNAWLKSYRSSEFAKNIQGEIYYHEHHKVIEEILKTNNVLVACNNEDPSQIYGFMCAGFTQNVFTVHYVYTKHTFRRMGIASALVKAFEYNPNYACICTHETNAVKKLIKDNAVIYHPYIALTPDMYKK